MPQVVDSTTWHWSLFNALLVAQLPKPVSHLIIKASRMKTLVFLLFLFGIHCGHTQLLKRQTLSSAGSSERIESPSGNYFIQQSIGQASVIGSFRVENRALRQGFIQALPAIVLGGDPNQLEVTVYPNPFTNGVVVSLEQGLEGPIATEVFDSSGRLVQTSSYEATSQVTIPMTGLAQGAYFLRLRTERQQVVKQLLKR